MEVLDGVDGIWDTPEAEFLCFWGAAGAMGSVGAQEVRNAEWESRGDAEGAEVFEKNGRIGSDFA